MAIHFARNSLEFCLKSKYSSPLGFIQIRNSSDELNENYEPKSLAKLIEVKEDLKKPAITKSITINVPDDVSKITGAPIEHIQDRLVRIYRTPKNAMQSGTNNVDVWEMEFDTRQRWENSLMGWCSSGDPLSNMKLRFDNEESASQFAAKNGFECYIEPGKPEKGKVKSYGFNFSWNKRTRVSTK